MTIDLTEVHLPGTDRVLLAPTTQVGTTVLGWLTQLIADHGLAQPDSVSFYPTRAHVWLRDETALGTAVAYAEQLDAAHPVLVQRDQFGDRAALVIAGTVHGLEVQLHLVTRAKLPDLALDVAELRRHVEADRATRAMSDVPAVLPKGEQA